MKKITISNFNDTPKNNLDENTLYAKSYPGALAKYIMECDSPINIALQGEWGSGKTSMMNMVLKELENSDVEYLGVFNAWLFSQFDFGNKLPIILLNHLMKELDYGELNDFLKKLSSITVDFLGKKLDISDNLKSHFSLDNVEELNNLKKEFSIAVENKLKKSNKKKLLIFVDDIDRVEPRKAVELLEAIKLFCECDGCVFVLAVDYDVILKGAKEKFEENKGQDFFDKIIQVPFNMPMATCDFDMFMKKLTENIIDPKCDNKSIDKVLKIYKEITELTIGNNPRSVKRLLNSFMITNFVAEGLNIYTNNSEINNYIKAMLYSLLCIENYNYDTYTCIVNSAESLDGGGIDDYISTINEILNDKDTDIEYNYETLKTYCDILNVLKEKGVDEEKIKKVFKASSSVNFHLK